VQLVRTVHNKYASTHNMYNIWTSEAEGVQFYHFFTIAWPCIVTDSSWIKPTDVLNSNFIGITTLHVSGSLSAHHQGFLAVHRFCDDHMLLLVAYANHNCIKMYQSRCTA